MYPKPPTPKTPPSKRVGPSKPKKPSLMNMMETNPKRIGKTAVPKQGRSPGAAAAAKGYEAEAVRAAAQTPRGQLLPQRQRKNKMGMGN